MQIDSGGHQQSGANAQRMRCLRSRLAHFPVDKHRNARLFFSCCRCYYCSAGEKSFLEIENGGRVRRPGYPQSDLFRRVPTPHFPFLPGPKSLQPSDCGVVPAISSLHERVPAKTSLHFPKTNLKGLKSIKKIDSKTSSRSFAVAHDVPQLKRVTWNALHDFGAENKRNKTSLIYTLRLEFFSTCRLPCSFHFFCVGRFRIFRERPRTQNFQNEQDAAEMSHHCILRRWQHFNQIH